MKRRKKDKGESKGLLWKSGHVGLLTGEVAGGRSKSLICSFDHSYVSFRDGSPLKIEAVVLHAFRIMPPLSINRPASEYFWPVKGLFFFFHAFLRGPPPRTIGGGRRKISKWKLFEKLYLDILLNWGGERICFYNWFNPLYIRSK